MGRTPLAGEGDGGVDLRERRGRAAIHGVAADRDALSDESSGGMETCIVGGSLAVSSRGCPPLIPGGTASNRLVRERERGEFHEREIMSLLFHMGRH